MNQNEEKASKEAGLQGETMDQLKEKKPWSSLGELGFFYVLNSTFRNILYILTLSQDCNMDPAPLPSSLFVDSSSDFFLFKIMNVKFQ